MASKKKSSHRACSVCGVLGHNKRSHQRGTKAFKKLQSEKKNR